MVRKSSDMVMLLSSRGKSRRGKAGGSILGAVTKVAADVFGVSRKQRDPGPSRASTGLLLAVCVGAACFGAGYVVGGKFGAGTSESAELRVKDPRRPGVIGEFDARKLTDTAFLVSLYTDADESVAKAKAQKLTEYLQGAGLPRTRPYLLQHASGPFWTVAVYYDGDVEYTASRNKLLALREVPDAEFQQLRRDRTAQGAENDWPISRSIQ